MTWTREPPTEPGFYPAAHSYPFSVADWEVVEVRTLPGPRPLPWAVKTGNNNRYAIEQFLWWGPRVEMPPPPWETPVEDGQSSD